MEIIRKYLRQDNKYCVLTEENATPFFIAL